MSDSATAFFGGMDVLINRSPVQPTARGQAIQSRQRSESKGDAFSEHLHRANDRQRSHSHRTSSEADDAKPARKDSRSEATDTAQRRVEHSSEKPVAAESTGTARADAATDASAEPGHEADHQARAAQRPAAESPEETLSQSSVEALDDADTDASVQNVVTQVSGELTAKQARTSANEVTDAVGETLTLTPEQGSADSEAIVVETQDADTRVAATEAASEAARVVGVVGDSSETTVAARTTASEQPAITRLGDTVSPSMLANRFRQLSTANPEQTGEPVPQQEDATPDTLKGASNVVSEASGKAVAASLTANSALLAGTRTPGTAQAADTDASLSADEALEADENSLILGKVASDNSAKGKISEHAQDKALSQEILREKLILEKDTVGRSVLESLASAAQADTRATANPAQSVESGLTAASVAALAAAPAVRMDSTTTTGVNAPLNVPLLASAASDSLSSNIRWMVREGVQSANVNVTPSGMGPISVKIGIDKDQMNVSIVALQGSTREALEQMLPRLREHLSMQGYESVRVDISDGRSEQSRGSEPEQYSQGGKNTQSEQADDGSQGSLADNAEAESDAAGTEHNTSGERILSESERMLVEQLQSIAGGTNASDLPLQHGYDLYV